MSTASSLPAAAPSAALRSVYTSSLPELFEQLKISLIVSTYQAGKVIAVRNDGGTINTHFRNFSKPMGVSADAKRLTIGGTNTVWHYHNMPALAPKLEPPGKHDACYLPRRIHVTGDIDIHELAWDRDGELWMVNTRFCCLCTLDADHSFYPRWRPPFVSALAPEDRCHLNGLCMVDGRPKYVTALGDTDSAGGWRANKAHGGILMDIHSNEMLLQGLSMPHSPRWYRDKLWLLESGEGSLAVADPRRGRWKTVAKTPGFTRGLDFYGPLAFIGLSQVRESAVFSGIPLVKRLKERTCGVWVVNIETGQTVGFLRFEEGVQEIFAVQVLPGVSFPELLEWDDPRLASSYVLPDEALSEVALPTEDELKRSPAFHFQQGMAAYQKGRLEEAINFFQECLVLQPEFPNARFNLGVALGDDGRYDEAIRHIKRVIETEPERAEAYNSLGYLNSCRRRPERAVECYRKAIELQPDHAQAHFNLGITLLQLGDYTAGFAEYEWRWRTPGFIPFACPHPQWDGSFISKKTLLIHTEPGAGAAIQMARYFPLAARRCAKLIVVCPQDLQPVFAAVSGIGQLRLPDQIQLTEFDTYLPIMSLPRVFSTKPENIPATIPYIDGELIHRRSDAGKTLSLPPTSSLKVGIVWAGSPAYRGDRQRSCHVRQFLPLLGTPGIEIYSLQKGEQQAQLSELPAGLQVHDLSGVLRHYGDTALLIKQLDLVIGVDTPEVHLAGALGKPVWTLLSHSPDWCWGLEGETTSWYSSMRLIRQHRPRDWSGCIPLVAEALERVRDRHESVLTV
ncbi:MAG: TIGR03032 family protein [Gammaproteobacteria bacterium]|nr:TIGR03032 family protein [Gammaproteobacteria bacterium]